MARILLVEDDEFFTHALRSLLKEEGHEVVHAANGKLAIAAMENSRFDLILSDVQMPVMSGPELVKWCRVHRPDTPTIMMTGYADTMGTLEALGAGAVNLLYKPFTDEEVGRAIKTAMAPIKPLRDDRNELSFSGYAKIPARAVAPGMAEFNLYRVGNDALEKVVSRGEPFQPEPSASKDYEHLFTEITNLHKLLGLNIMVTKAVVKSRDVPVARKATALRITAELISVSLRTKGLNEGVFTDVQEFAKCCVDAIEVEPAEKLLEHLGTMCECLCDTSLRAIWGQMQTPSVKEMDQDQKYMMAAATLLHSFGVSRQQLTERRYFPETIYVNFSGWRSGSGGEGA